VRAAFKAKHWQALTTASQTDAHAGFAIHRYRSAMPNLVHCVQY
jgi:hypothetical protein